MKLEDIFYFSVKKQQHIPVFELANKVVEDSQTDTTDSAEIQRRLTSLSKTENSEHIRQCTNFLAETIAFTNLVDKGLSPHWVPETKKHKMPDIAYEESGRKTPVEVKHLNSPHEEHEALSTIGTYGGSVNNKYDNGLVKKIGDFIDDARAKFLSFNSQINNDNDCSTGILYLYFSKSIDAGLLDGIEWGENMFDRVSRIAEPLAGDDINLIVADIDSVFQESV